MSAERLRAAAALMRSRAATPPSAEYERLGDCHRPACNVPAVGVVGLMDVDHPACWGHLQEAEVITNA